MGDGAAQGLEAQEGAGRERYEAYWQQVEELTCSLVAISSGGGDAGGGSRGSCHDTTLQPLAGEVLLPPGTSLLTFLAAPVQRGLYKALHLRALLQQLPVHVDVQPPEPLWQQQEAAAVVAAAAAHSRGAMSPQALRRSSRAGVPRGGPLAPVAGGAPLAQHQPHHPGDAPAGMHDAETILLDVEQAQPRVQLSLVAAGGRLIAGQEQWLGLALAPERDALRHARLELTWPLAGAAGALPGGCAVLLPARAMLAPCYVATPLPYLPDGTSLPAVHALPAPLCKAHQPCLSCLQACRLTLAWLPVLAECTAQHTRSEAMSACHRQPARRRCPRLRRPSCVPSTVALCSRPPTAAAPVGMGLRCCQRRAPLGPLPPGC